MQTAKLGAGINESNAQSGRGSQRTTSGPYWQQWIDYGYGKGKELFQDDPRMKEMLQRRQDLSQGYSGQELGALREGARREIAGQRQGYLGQMRSNLARQGVGGARAAAMTDAANQKYAQAGAQAERQMLLDSAKLKREGVSDLQDYLFRQKYGELGTGMGYGQMAVAENAAQQMRNASRDTRQPGILGSVLDALF